MDSMHYDGPIYPITAPLIGITGKKGSGKDTVAGLLQRNWFWTPCAFAGELKAIAKRLWDLSEDQVNGSIQEKERVDPRWGCSPRHLLQTLGTEAGRAAHPETWIRFLLQQIAQKDQPVDFHHPPRAGWVVTDVRFPNEASAIRKHGGVIWRVERDGGTGHYTDHASETSIDLIVPDRIILNDGTLDDLWAKISGVKSQH